MKYRFIYKENDGWWLKIDSLKDLFDYYDKVDNHRMTDGWDSATNCKEFNTKHNSQSNQSKPHATYLGYCIGLRAAINKTSALQAITDMQEQKLNAQIEELYKGNNIYINRSGGWHFGKNDYKQWCDKEVLVFPDFKKNQIKIEKFPGGVHFYAYIDNMQVRDGDILKWNTYEEAYKQASKYIKEEV